MTNDQIESMLRLMSEIVDVGYKIANELSQANMIADGKKDISDYDPTWADIPGMEKSNVSK